jgi:hypothetical protein
MKFQKILKLDFLKGLIKNLIFNQKIDLFKVYP